MGAGCEEWSWMYDKWKRGNLEVDGEADIDKGQWGTSVQTGQPRKRSLWSQGRLWLLGDVYIDPVIGTNGVVKRQDQRGISGRHSNSLGMREERGRADKLLGKKVNRAEVMAMGVEKKANCQSELPMLCLNKHTSLTSGHGIAGKHRAGNQCTGGTCQQPSRYSSNSVNLEQLHSIKFLLWQKGSTSVLSNMVAINQPHVAIEHLKYGKCNWDSAFEMFISF